MSRSTTYKQRITRSSRERLTKLVRHKRRNDASSLQPKDSLAGLEVFPRTVIRLQPCCANARARCRPIPEPAPVIKAAVPATFIVPGAGVWLCCTANRSALLDACRIATASETTRNFCDFCFEACQHCSSVIFSHLRLTTDSLSFNVFRCLPAVEPC